ncbi:hypothetical protein Tco_0846816 [Tanacetum coccineum]
MDMILGEDIRRRNFGEYPNSLLSATGHRRKSNRGRSLSRKNSPSENTKNIMCWNYGQKRHIRSIFIQVSTTRYMEAHNEASKDLNALAEILRGLDKQMERKDDSGLYFVDRIWVLVSGNRSSFTQGVIQERGPWRVGGDESDVDACVRIGISADLPLLTSWSVSSSSESSVGCLERLSICPDLLTV